MTKNELTATVLNESNANMNLVIVGKKPHRLLVLSSDREELKNLKSPFVLIKDGKTWVGKKVILNQENYQGVKGLDLFTVVITGKASEFCSQCCCKLEKRKMSMGPWDYEPIKMYCPRCHVYY